jgi:hypothetical protein
MSYAAKIIEAFGGSRKMSRELSVNDRHYPPTTVQSWKDAGFIPSQHQSWVLLRAQELGLPVEMKDFFDLPAGESEAAASGKSEGEAA